MHANNARSSNNAWVLKAAFPEMPGAADGMAC